MRLYAGLLLCGIGVAFAPVSDPALGHPASRAYSISPIAPVPIPVAIAVDACLCAYAILVALGVVSWWSFLIPLILAVAILTVYGRRAAKALGIRSRDETPRRWLVALATTGGLVGTAAAHTNQYVGLILTAYFVFLQIAERIIWTRYLASK